MFRSFALTLLIFTTLPGLGAEIELRREAKPTGSVVRMGDISVIRSDNLVERNRLASIPLMPTPSQGTTQYLRAQSVRDLLKANGEDLSKHRFTGAINIKVEMMTFASEANPEQWDPIALPESQNTSRRNRDTGYRLPQNEFIEATQSAPSQSRRAPNRRQLLSAQQRVREAIEAWLNTQGEAGKLIAVGQIKVEEIDLDRLHQYRSRELVAEAMGFTSAAPGVGKFMVAPLNGEPSYAAAELIGLKPIVASTRNISRGEVITAARVLVKGILPEEFEKSRAKPYTTLESVLGRIASRTIRSDELVTDGNTTTPLLVRRGETVSVATGSNGITVRMQAVAMSDGRIGDLVLVETLDEVEQFQARVTGRSELAVLSTSSFNAQLATGTPVGVIR